MAKNKSILEFSGTLGDKTYVDNAVYGSYVRSRRGTFKKAELNEACKKSSSTVVNANQIAKMIFDPVKILRGKFSGGDFWQRLISYFWHQIDTHAPIGFSGLDRMEIKKDYKLERLLYVQLTDRSPLHDAVTLKYDISKRNDKYYNGYCLTLIRIACLPDFSKTYPAERRKCFVPFDETLQSVIFEFSPLPAETEVIYCLKAEMGKNNTRYIAFSSTGMILLR